MWTVYMAFYLKKDLKLACGRPPGSQAHCLCVRGREKKREKVGERREKGQRNAESRRKRQRRLRGDYRGRATGAGSWVDFARMLLWVSGTGGRRSI